MMKIIGSLTSPYTRITRVVCEELGVAYEMEITPPFGGLTKEKDQFIGEHNPLRRVPVLVDGDTEIFDSRVIVHYLLKKQPKPQTDFRVNFPANIAEENIATVIYGVIDAGILRFVLGKSNPEINVEGGYMARSLNRIADGLAWLEKQSALGQSFGVPEAALICCLHWFQKRSIYDWSHLARLGQIYSAYSERPSLIQTRIPDTL